MDSHDIAYQLEQIRSELKALRKEVASLRRHLGDSDIREQETRSRPTSTYFTPDRVSRMIDMFMREMRFDEQRPSRPAGFSPEPEEPPRSHPGTYPGATEIARWIEDALADRERRNRSGESDDTGRDTSADEDPDETD